MPNASHFERLPEEIISQICRHLAEPPRQQYSGYASTLLSLSSTCRTLHACAAGYLWRDLDISINAENIQHQLAKLERLVDHDTHPARAIVPKLNITLNLPRPEDVDTPIEATSARVGLCILQLVRWVTRLRHLELDFKYATRNMTALYSTLRQVLGDSKDGNRLDSLALKGIYRGHLPFQMAAQAHITALRLEHVGYGTFLDLSLFSALQHLHLEIDCRDEEEFEDGDPCLCIPPSLWTDLRTFILSLYGWEHHAQRLVRNIEASIETNQDIPNLVSLGIFWNLDTDDWCHLVEGLFSRFTKTQIRKLALTIPDLPSSAFIKELSHQFPQVTELTLCAFLHSGSWPWPEEVSSYADALSQFKHLEHLAVNHDDTAFTLDADGNADLIGKFSFDSSADAALLRLQFGKAVATQCRRLRSISFCTADQPSGCLLFKDTNSQATAYAVSLKSAPTLFWQD